MADDRKTGRPSKYVPDMADRAKAMCANGALDADLATAFGVSLATLYRWKAEFREFLEATTRGKEVADNAVEFALFRRATGYSHDAVKIMQYEGDPVEVPYVEHFPPDTQACVFWLKNRRPDKWRDKIEQTHAGEVTVTWLQPNNLDLRISDLK